jgi:hypothetical protein
MISFDSPPVPTALNRFQVGSSVQVQSLLPFKRFVNHICSALSLAHPHTNDENVRKEVEVAYDCATNDDVTR